MKTPLLALFAIICGYANAQCDPSFSYSFDSTTDKLTCWPNDTIGEHNWSLNNWGYFIGNDGNFILWELDTLILTLPYGHSEIEIVHGSICGYASATVVVDNFDGSYCNANFYSIIEPAVMDYYFFGADYPGINHAWLYGVDTISTDYLCGFLPVDAFQLTHIVYDNNGCYSSVTDTFYYNNYLVCNAQPTIYPTPNGLPYQYNLRSYSSNLLTHTWTVDGDTISNGFIFDYELLKACTMFA
ncbi:MAG: hypothetical protein M0D57_10175 [Sphingobacteriales bacterium JAD_PAG50586_3]|nr:MAG: hypothetical protein M0D57_10175 [Sphingobacteriales bacterium JAD_PAG50586_3]